MGAALPMLLQVLLASHEQAKHVRGEEAQTMKTKAYRGKIDSADSCPRGCHAAFTTTFMTPRFSGEARLTARHRYASSSAFAAVRAEAQRDAAMRATPRQRCRSLPRRAAAAAISCRLSSTAPACPPDAATPRRRYFDRAAFFHQP